MCGAQCTYRNNKYKPCSTRFDGGGSGVCMVAEFSVIFLFENFQKIRKKWFRNKNVGMSNVELYSHRKPKVFNVQVFCVE